MPICPHKGEFVLTPLSQFFNVSDHDQVLSDDCFVLDSKVDEVAIELRWSSNAWRPCLLVGVVVVLVDRAMHLDLVLGRGVEIERLSLRIIAVKILIVVGEDVGWVLIGSLALSNCLLLHWKRRRLLFGLGVVLSLIRGLHQDIIDIFNSERYA